MCHCQLSFHLLVILPVPSIQHLQHVRHIYSDNSFSIRSASHSLNYCYLIRFRHSFSQQSFTLLYTFVRPAFFVKWLPFFCFYIDLCNTKICRSLPYLTSLDRMLHSIYHSFLGIPYRQPCIIYPLRRSPVQ